jgi:2'-hydroxyisoflavone reductase
VAVRKNASSPLALWRRAGRRSQAWVSKVTRLRVLLLGGTHFVGRAIAEVALASGHHVTIVNRGLTGHVTPGTNHIRVDRTDTEALRSALTGQTWDSVIDTWSGAPLFATVAAQLLGPTTTTYGYVSSRSVHLWPLAVGADETAEVVTADAESIKFDDYSVAKRGSELGILASRPDALIARAGLILGPYEDIGRLPSWLTRMKGGGKVLAPGPMSRPLQYIDARDLGHWMLSCAQRQIGGVFNAVSRSGHTTFGELINTVHQVTQSSAEMVWLTPEEIKTAGLAEWSEVPIWLAPDSEFAAMHDGDVTAAVRAGLLCRPILDTVRDTWAWMQSEGAPQQRPDRPVHGITRDRESQILATLGR